MAILAEKWSKANILLTYLVMLVCQALVNMHIHVRRRLFIFSCAHKAWAVIYLVVCISEELYQLLMYVSTLTSQWVSQCLSRDTAGETSEVRLLSWCSCMNLCMPLENKNRTQWSLFYFWCVLFNCIPAIHSYKEIICCQNARCPGGNFRGGVS